MESLLDQIALHIIEGSASRRELDAPVITSFAYGNRHDAPLVDADGQMLGGHTIALGQDQGAFETSISTLVLLPLLTRL